MGYTTGADGGDWEGINAKGGNDAIILKLNKDLEVVKKQNFGGAYNESFLSVTPAIDGGYVCVGEADSTSIGTGDMSNLVEKGKKDGIIVKFDEELKYS